MALTLVTWGLELTGTTKVHLPAPHGHIAKRSPHASPSGELGAWQLHSHRVGDQWSCPDGFFVRERLEAVLNQGDGSMQREGQPRPTSRCPTS